VGAKGLEQYELINEQSHDTWLLETCRVTHLGQVISRLVLVQVSHLGVEELEVVVSTSQYIDILFVTIDTTNRYNGCY
jgi:hypothetical protein